jgi:hypothetical protein
VNEKEPGNFVDIRFFLGLLLFIYGLILSINGLYYQSARVFEFSKNINLLYGPFLLMIGCILYWRSSKPGRWRAALGHSGIETIEKRMKWPRKARTNN